MNSSYGGNGVLGYGWSLALGSALLLGATPAMAAEITVDSLADNIAVDGSCTLREAIISANTNVAAGDCVAGESGARDTISFANGLFEFGDNGLEGRLTLTKGELPTLGGPGAGPLTISGTALIDAGGNSRFFTNAGTTTLEFLILENGSASGATANDNSGGAVLNTTGGVLTVSGSTFVNNSAARAGGAIEEASGAPAGITAVTISNSIFQENNAGNSPGNGGALHVTGSADINISGTPQTGGGTEFDDNVASNEGGAVWNGGGTMTITGTSFTNNISTGEFVPGSSDSGQGGGAIYNNATGGAGTVNLTSTVIDGNTANGASASGGGIYNAFDGTLIVTGGSITNNRAVRAGGGIETGGAAGGDGASEVILTQVSMTGNSAGNVTVDGTTTPANPGNGGGLHVTGSGNVTINTSLVSRNTAASEGGGLWNSTGDMTLIGASVLQNSAAGDAADNGGGGIFNNGGTLTVESDRQSFLSASRIAGNAATGASGSGGGVFNAGGLVIINSTEISSNTANRAGGGIENVDGRVNLFAVTLGGTSEDFANSAGSNPGNGGGLHNGGTARADINSSSVGFNTAADEGGGLWNSGTGLINVNRSTLSRNNAGSIGGGAYQVGNPDSGATAFIFSTVTRNSAGESGGGLGIGFSAQPGFNLLDSLVGDNTAPANADVDEALLATHINSIVGIDSTAITRYRLYGRTTATQPLASIANNPAIDHISDGDCSSLGFDLDQRGAARPFNFYDDEPGSDCDTGAFELTDDPVVTVTRNGADAADFNLQDSNVVVLALTLANTNEAGSGGITVGGVSGAISINTPVRDADRLFLLANIRIAAFIDDGDTLGEFDANDTPAGNTNLILRPDLTFTLQFDSGAGQFLSPGDSTSYLLVAQPTARQAALTLPIFAGGTLIALLGLFSVGGLRRRTQWLLVIVILTVALSACHDGNDNVNVNGNIGNGGSTGGGSNGGGGENDGDGSGTPPPVINAGTIKGDIQFVAISLDPPSNAQDTDLVIGDGLPIRGPALTQVSVEQD